MMPSNQKLPKSRNRPVSSLYSKQSSTVTLLVIVKLNLALTSEQIKQEVVFVLVERALTLIAGGKVALVVGVNPLQQCSRKVREWKRKGLALDCLSGFCSCSFSSESAHIHHLQIPNLL